MLELVTRLEAYNHLRTDEADDGWLTAAIPAVSEQVALWLKDSWRLYNPEIDSDGEVVIDSDGDPVPATIDGEPVVRPVVKLAVLVELASMYRFREGEGKDNVVTPDAGYGYVLNKASTSLLTPLRKPTVA